jgi:MOSC domain-containing protein YiiM
MKLLSVNITEPKLVEIKGQQVLTGIYKLPVQRAVWLGKLSLVGDGQADKAVHGGVHQAVYSYPVEHYAYWQNKLGLSDLPFGTFGENFTTSGLNEDEIHVGDVLKIGEAVVQITMPRIPCFKFGHKIGRPDVLEEFLKSGRSGFYMRVLTEGYVKAGDAITLRDRDPQAISIRMALIMQKLDLALLDEPAALLQKALQVESLAPLLNTIYTKRLAELG